MFVESSVLLLVHRCSLLYVLDVSVPSSVVNVVFLDACAKAKQLDGLLDEVQLQRIVQIEHEVLLRLLKEEIVLCIQLHAVFEDLEQELRPQTLGKGCTLFVHLLEMGPPLEQGKGLLVLIV